VESEMLEKRCGLCEELDAVYNQFKYRRSEESKILAETKQAEENLSSLEQDFANLNKTIAELTEQLVSIQTHLLLYLTTPFPVRGRSSIKRPSWEGEQS